MALNPRATTPVGQNGALPFPQLLWNSGQVVAIGASSVASAILNTSLDTVADITATSSCWIHVDTTPTAASAVAGCMFLSAGEPRMIYVPANQKVAAIQAQTSGTLCIIPAAVQP